MENLIISPIISLMVYNAKTPKQSLIEVNGRPFYALTYRKQGTIKINIDGKTIVSKKNCVTMTPRNKSYTTEIIEDTHIIAIHFNCLDDTKLQKPFVLENASPVIAGLFDILSSKYSNKGFSDCECFSLFYELLAEILKEFETADEKNLNAKIIESKKEIDKHFSENNFNISTLAYSLSINPSYLRREFKKAYSVSPISYLKNKRLQSAISMLISDYYSIDEIAKKCGYGSASYFIQVFHKSKGCSPHKYKQKHLNYNI